MRAGKHSCQIDTYDNQSEADAIDALCMANGHTRDMPRAWGDPDALLEQQDFFKV